MWYGVIRVKPEVESRGAKLCEFLLWDTSFFGCRIARATVNQLSPQILQDILEWCRSHAVDCLYFLSASDHQETVRVAEDNGFRFVDIRVTLQCELKDRPTMSDNSAQSLTVRPSRETDIPVLQSIAHASYRDSRFYFDPCFPEESCRSLYQTWIKCCCEGNADVVLVAEINDQIVGYVSCHLTSRIHGEIGLVGVDSAIRSRGVGKVLVHHSLNWLAAHHIQTVRVVTQGRNIAAQRLYQHCGFLTHSLQLWYHKWLSDGSNASL
jgi:dTDP-4-amino-4,6-dideoxy-D-galactose acyltransferase